MKPDRQPSTTTECEHRADMQDCPECKQEGPTPIPDGWKALLLSAQKAVDTFSGQSTERQHGSAIAELRTALAGAPTPPEAVPVYGDHSAGQCARGEGPYTYLRSTPPVGEEGHRETLANQVNVESNTKEK